VPQAVAAKSFLPGVADIKEFRVGDVRAALDAAEHKLSGRLLLGEGGGARKGFKLDGPRGEMDRGGKRSRRLR
jgi:hypothetical protein